MRLLLSAKIHGGEVTECDLNYEGSCGLGPDLRAASGILPLEKVAIANLSTGERWETYVIADSRPSAITLNGAAARHANPGDKVILMAYRMVSDEALSGHRAKIVVLGPDNEVAATREDSPA